MIDTEKRNNERVRRGLGQLRREQDKLRRKKDWTGVERIKRRIKKLEGQIII